jgi:outer membrane protein TolC
VKQKLRFAQDTVVAEVRDAESAVRQAHLRISAARESVDLARRMEEAERLQLVEGNSDLLRVNLREQQSARAASFLVEVNAQYFEALADYRAAVGLTTDP